MKVGFALLSSMSPRHAALRVAIPYALFGTLWILFSGQVVERLVRDTGQMYQAELVKGVFFILATALLVYGLVYRDSAALQRFLRLLQDSEHRSRRIIETTAEGVVLFRTGEGGRIQWVNARFAAMLGRNPAELYGRSFAEFLAPEPAPVGWWTRYVPGQHEAAFQRADGGEVRALVTCSALRDEPDQPDVVLAMVTDITERYRAEQEVDRVFNLSPEMLCIADLRGYLRRVNRAWQRTLGYAPGEMAGVFYLDLVHPEDQEATKAALAALQTGQPLAELEVRNRHRSGEYRWLAWAAQAVPKEGVIYGAARDVTEAKRVAAASRESEAHFRRVFTESPIGILLFDHNGELIDANRACLGILGVARQKDLRGYRLFEEPTLPTNARARLSTGAVVRYETRFDVRAPERCRLYPSERTGTIDLDVVIAPVHDAQPDQHNYLVMLQDTTERRRLEEQLRHAQKIEAVGQLAGGVAHDFNNVLTAVFANVELIRGALEDPQSPFPVAEGLDQIDRSAQRAAVLTRQLLAFSRRQVMRTEVLNVNQVIGDVEKMLRRLIREDIELTIQTAPHLWSVRADAGQLEQVVVNLVVNARDALPHGGRILVHTANVDLDGDYAAHWPEARPGPHVALTVSDNGQGMDRQTLDHLFEPFFTTKPIGQGTGLGLATVHGIIRQFNGHITVRSEPGHGSTFQVYLPAVAGPVTERAAIRIEQSPRGVETVLVCEDDEAVRQLATIALRRQGYTVLSAGSPEAALALAAAHAGDIHLLLADLVMPEMNGKELAERLHELRPDLRVLYISGYPTDLVAQHGLFAGEVELLDKPFRSGTLIERVRRVLDANR